MTGPGYPQGIQTLLGIAASSPDLREKVLADPLAVAAEHAVDLSESERKILAQIRTDRLAQMIDRITDNVAAAGAGLVPRPADEDIRMVTLGHMPDKPEPMPPPPTPVTGSRSDLPKKGCAALAALTALGVGGTCLMSTTVTTGISPDIPRRRHLLGTSDISRLDHVLKTAADEDRPVMAVFLHPALGAEDQDLAEAQKRCFTNDDLRKHISDSSIILIGLRDPWEDTRGKRLSDAEAREYGEREDPYEAKLVKYGIKGQLPAVVFLAPDGSVLKSLIRPKTSEALRAAVDSVPQLMTD